MVLRLPGEWPWHMWSWFPIFPFVSHLLFKRKDTCLKKLTKLLDFIFLFFVLQELDSVLCGYVCICLICKCAGYGKLKFVSRVQPLEVLSSNWTTFSCTIAELTCQWALFDWLKSTRLQIKGFLIFTKWAKMNFRPSWFCNYSVLNWYLLLEVA